MTWGNPPKFNSTPPKQGKKINPEDLAGTSEGSQQKAVMVWAALNSNRYPQLKRLAHIPNGGSRDIREAVELKAQGVKPGIPDLILPWPNSNFHGLFIELKIKSGKVSDEQKDWLDYLISVGYKAIVCWSWEDAILELEKYCAL